MVLTGLGLNQPFCLEFACSYQVLQLPPTVPGHGVRGVRLTGDSKLPRVEI